MEQYISKSAVVAEIESKFQKYWKMGEESDALQDGNAKYWGGVLSCLNEVKTLIDTLEVKEVDLDKIVDDWYNTKASKEFENVLYSDIENCAKYFFELGLMHRKDNLYGNKY